MAKAVKYIIIIIKRNKNVYTGHKKLSILKMIYYKDVHHEIRTLIYYIHIHIYVCYCFYSKKKYNNKNKNYNM